MSIRRVTSGAGIALALICPIDQASFLLRRHIQKLEESFLNEGGFTERLYRARRNSRAGRTGRTGQTGRTRQT